MEESYLKHPELKKVGVIKDFYYLKESLMGLRIANNILKADNHKYIKMLIDRIPKNHN